jgi:hypothetical protein
MAFADTWVPNIVCTFGGIIVSGLIGFWQGRRSARVQDKHTLMLENLLIGFEKQGVLELARDKDGRITGGRNITVKVEGLRAEVTLGQVSAEQVAPASTDR